MSDGRRSETGNAIVVIIVVLIVIGVLGIVGVGGGMLLIQRMTVARVQAEVQERRAMAEMMEAEMRARVAQMHSAKAVAPLETQCMLEIDASGDYVLDGQPLTADELQAALQRAVADHPDGVQLKIQAERETPFERVSQAMAAANAAGVTSQSVATQP
jgi:biopolymer transport protein ExbD